MLLDAIRIGICQKDFNLFIWFLILISLRYENEDDGFFSDLLWDMISRYLTIFVKHSNISNINWKVLPLKNACKRNSVKDRFKQNSNKAK